MNCCLMPIGFVVDEAHAAGLKVTGHLGGPTTSLRAVELGIDGLEHGIFAVAEFTDVLQDGPLTAQYCALAELDVSKPEAEALIDAIVRAGVWVTPTTVTLGSIHPGFVPPAPDASDYLSERLREILNNMPAYLDADGADCLERALDRQAEFVHAVQGPAASW